MSLSQHPLNAKFPKSNGKLQYFHDIGRVLAKSPSNPEALADYISTGVPQLGLHIISFQDATVVTLTWLHTLLDAMGRHALLRAWTAVLEGRDDDVPEFLGYDTNPLADLGATEVSQKDEFLLKKKLLGGLGMRTSSRSKSRRTSISTPWSSRNSHIVMLGRERSPFISDGDILTAWFTRLIASTNPTVTSSSPTRTITIMNVLGMRDILRTAPPLLPRSTQGVYIHNCAAAIFSHFTVADFLAKPLGHIAAQLRSDLVRQSTREKVEAAARIARDNGGMAFATIVGGTAGTYVERTRGKPTFIHVYTTLAPGLSLRGSGNCVGRDAHGNWWLGTIMRAEFVEGFRRAAEGMS
ncbi:hypothetical protein EK21DRAFT_94534 [Setomelanomma holmii]|uniref:Uncharacterized protein n=1 Tax=Setomelanomma holmii TaxID=210430 RepID=A0A9P4LG58_9PLEO|nr:hypothetical protein EK21DRAFT_94534 [Setomelanomma holmii]